MKILFLLPFAPRLDAVHGGGRVTAQFIDAVASLHQVGIVYLRGEDEPKIDESLQERCPLVVEVRRASFLHDERRRWVRNLRLVVSLLHLQPMWVTDLACPPFAERVREICREWHPNLVQVESHVMGQYLASLQECEVPALLVEHEPGIRSALYLKRLPGSLGQFIHRIDRLAWKRYESHLIRNVQATVVFTKTDQEALESLDRAAPIYTIPFGTTIPAAPLNPLGCPPLSLLFFGSFVHPPNIEAALRLVRQIFPAVQMRFPELKLYIVGDQPPPELSRFASEKVIITGKVPDLTPYLDRAAVVVIPLSSGAGMRVKTLEALAAGKAVVATGMAISGLNLAEGEQVLLADEDKDLVEAVACLLAHPEQRAALAKGARAWASANLGWKKSIEAYEELYRALISRPGRAGGFSLPDD